jgi:hypothetical protein
MPYQHIVTHVATGRSWQTTTRKSKPPHADRIALRGPYEDGWAECQGCHDYTPRSPLVIVHDGRRVVVPAGEADRVVNDLGGRFRVEGPGGLVGYGPATVVNACSPCQRATRSRTDANVVRSLERAAIERLDRFAVTLSEGWDT